MQDTTTSPKFVLFDCDTRCIAAEFSSDTPQALTSALSAYSVRMGFSESVVWRRVSLRLFYGVPAFFETSDTAYLLLPSALAFYKTEGRRLVTGDSQYWTFEDSDAAELDFRARYPNGVSVTVRDVF